MQFPEYADFLEAFREQMMAISSEFVLGEEAGEGRKLEQVSILWISIYSWYLWLSIHPRSSIIFNWQSPFQVPAFLGSLLCARWPRGMHRDTQEVRIMKEFIFFASGILRNLFDLLSIYEFLPFGRVLLFSRPRRFKSLLTRVDL